MKKIRIKQAVLAATLLAGIGMAYAEESALHVVFCKATVVDGGENERYVSVTLPPTEGYYDNDGNPLTYWNVGDVVAGGVTDSWHGEGGPGRFTARNEGNVGAYCYVTTSGNEYSKFTGDSDWDGGGQVEDTSGSTDFWSRVDTGMFGNYGNKLNFPHISPREMRMYGDGVLSYHLAFTTDTTAKVPTWHSLDHRYMGGTYWITEEGVAGPHSEVAGYMGYVEAGDYLTFDLKFWAPREVSSGNSLLFTFCVEASPFPLWEHDRVVE